MSFFRIIAARSRIATWIASFAILMAAISPSISQALAAQDGAKGSWIEICSTGGSKFVRLSSDGQPQSESTPHTGGCPFCGLHSGLALPTVALTIGLNADQTTFSLDLDVLRPKSEHWPWPASRSRAPPQLG